MSAQTNLYRGWFHLCTGALLSLCSSGLSWFYSSWDLLLLGALHTKFPLRIIFTPVQLLTWVKSSLFYSFRVLPMKRLWFKLEIALWKLAFLQLKSNAFVANALLLYKSALKPGKSGKSFSESAFLGPTQVTFCLPCSHFCISCGFFNELCMHSNAPWSLSLPNVMCKCCKGSSPPVEALDLCSKVTLSRLIQAMPS